MDRKFVEQAFFQEYGYRGDDDELEYFAMDNGYFFGNPDLSYEQYRHRAPGYSSGYADSNAADFAGDVKSECGALFRDIFGKAKKHESNEHRDELMAEFSFMALLFLVKASLYFTLQYGNQHGYCCNL